MGEDIDGMMPDCKICLRPFDLGAHLPRLLTCGCVMCHDCIEALIKMMAEPDRYPEGDIIECPLCKKLFSGRLAEEFPAANAT